MGQGAQDRRARPDHPVLRGAALRRRRRRRDAHGDSAALPAEDARRSGRPVKERPPVSRAALWHPERRGGGPRRLVFGEGQEEGLTGSSSAPSPCPLPLWGRKELKEGSGSCVQTAGK